MIKIYTLIVKAMNGTVTMMSAADSFMTRELAEETEKAVLEVNKDSEFPIVTEIQESTIFESKDEIPILNKVKDINNN